MHTDRHYTNRYAEPAHQNSQIPRGNAASFHLGNCFLERLSELYFAQFL